MYLNLDWKCTLEVPRIGGIWETGIKSLSIKIFGTKAELIILGGKMPYGSNFCYKTDKMTFDEYLSG